MSRRLDLDALLDELAERIAAKLRASAPAVKPSADGAGDVFLTAAEVASRTSSTASHWRSLASRGTVPARRDGRRLLFRWSDVERYLEPSHGAGGGVQVDELLAKRARRGRP